MRPWWSDRDTGSVGDLAITSNPVPDMTLQEAADELGVHYMTAYRYVRLGRLVASKEGNSWVVTEADLEDFRTTASEPRERADWAGEFERLLIAGDPAAAWVLIEDALASSFTPAEVDLDIILPSMRSVGQRWAAGEIGIAEEHLASAVARRCVSRLSPRFHRRGVTRGTVVVAMGPGEWHQLGAEVLADLLRGENFHVLFLGANTPPEAVVLAIERAGRPIACCLAAFQSAESVAAVTSAVEAAYPDMPLILGGPAVGSAERADELGGSHFVADLPSTVELVASLA